MPRPLRVHVPGGFYHVTLRGNHRQAIFFSLRDRNLLDDIVAQTISHHGARVHAYCWMTNHLHLLIQVAEMPLSRLILRIASRYARTVQAVMKTTGHLFERRYHAVLVDADNYLLELIRYIHLNPVRGGLVADPGEYPWSSHRVYIAASQAPWVTTEFALALFSAERGRAVSAYQEFLASSEEIRWGSGRLEPNSNDARVLGDDAFLARVREKDWRPPDKRSLEDLIGEANGRFGVVPWSSQSRRRTRACAWIANQAVAGSIASVCAVARRLGRSEAAIRRAMLRYPPEAD
ncbi:MAG: transposase [Gammaproteobacteria bacterium]|nr:transposase [Gammaproteobacteria bacterium]